MALNAVHNERLECPKVLLENLVRTVHLLLDVCVFRQSVFYLLSGLNLLQSHVKAILRHGAKINHHLIFSQTSFALFDSWLEESLLDHSLLNTLCETFPKKKDFYHEWAFIRNETFYQAFLKCLYAFSSRNFELLNTVPSFTTGFKLPIAFDMPLNGVPVMTSIHPHSTSKLQVSSASVNVPSVSVSTKCIDKSTSTMVYQNDDTDSRIPDFSYSYGSPVVSPDFYQLENPSRPELQLDCRPDLPRDLSESFKKTVRPSHIHKPVTKSFLESGGFVQPAALGNFQLPQKGQSLTSFLSTFSDSMPELDRENAHFNVSEALISAFESLKVKQKAEDLKERIHFEKMEAMFGETVDSSHRVFNQKKFLARQQQQRKAIYTETEESEFESNWRQQPRRPPAHIKKKPRFPSKLGSDGHSESFFSTTEVTTSGSQSFSSSSEDIGSSSFSAESVALNLLRNAKMKDVELPDASELQWMVTERDAPQALLPMPKNWNSASESETDSLDKSMRLRGTTEWAPPRPQIIFTIHRPPHLQTLIEAQKYRCAGCGMKVEPKYAGTFRYCHYLGRYFCTGCHQFKKHRLPQMILHRWDFSPYFVSNFSATLLESLQSDPVYNVLAINPNLSRKGKIWSFRSCRIQLKFLTEYLKNCKAAIELYEELEKFPTYYTKDVDLYSLEDLIQLRFTTGLPMKAKDVVTRSVHHVLNCKLCHQLGFHCEVCKKNDVIFPFQVNKVSRCGKCSSCFHFRCFNPRTSECPKCLRLHIRRNTPVYDVIEIPV